MINSILSFFFLLLFLFSFFCSSYFWLENKKLKTKVLQSEINLEMASKFFLEEANTKVSNEDQAREDFIKFLSDSRDWSYSYIENAQEMIHKFIKDVEPEINYFDEYGAVGEGWPHYYSMKKISSAYKELKGLLPEDYGRIDE